MRKHHHFFKTLVCSVVSTVEKLISCSSVTEKSQPTKFFAFKKQLAELVLCYEQLYTKSSNKLNLCLRSCISGKSIIFILDAIEIFENVMQICIHRCLNQEDYECKLIEVSDSFGMVQKIYNTVQIPEISQINVLKKKL